MGTLVAMRGLCVVLVSCMVWTTQAAPGSAVGVNGYRRFHANDSLIGQRVPCSHQDKLCFRFNMLQKYGQCVAITYDFSERLICATSNGDHIRIDDNEFLNGSGKLKHKYEEDDCFDYGGYRMAYDGKCYEKELVSNTLCGCDAKPTRHFLGGSECRCTAPTPIEVEQPEEEGRCRIPDLRFPDRERRHFLYNPFEDIQGFKSENETIVNLYRPVRFACTPEQGRCFSQQQVWISEANGCFPLLERGPCPEEHVVALDTDAAKRGRAEGTCVHVRGECPQGYVRMAFDNQCHNYEDMKVVVPGAILQNEYGIYVAWDDFYTVTVQLVLQDTNFCVVVRKFSSSNMCSFASVPCHNDDGCKRFEVISTPPMPQI